MPVNDTASAGPQEWASPEGGAPATATAAVAAAATASPAQPTASPAGAAPPAANPAPASGTAPQATPTFRSWQPGIIPLRPQSFGEFLAAPFKAMRFNRAVVLGGPLLCMVIAMLLGAAALWLALTDSSLALMNPSEQFTGIEAQTIIVGIAAFLALVLADSVATAIVAPGFARAVLGERITLSTALRQVMPRIGHLLLLWLVSAIVATIAFAPGIVAIAVGAGAGDGGTVALGVITLLAFLVPVGLLLGVIAPVARCALVLEQIGVVAAIRRTFSLIRGRFWWSVLIVVVTGTIINIVMSIVQNVGGLGASVVIVLAPQAEWLAMALLVGITAFFTVVSYVFISAYMGSVYALIYVDVRIRFEGFDLELARAAEARRA